MKNLLLILVLSLFSIQSFAGSCPDGSEPVKSVSDDGSYFVYNCGGSNEQSSSSTNSNIKPLAGIDIENDPNLDFFKLLENPVQIRQFLHGVDGRIADFNNDGLADVIYIGIMSMSINGIPFCTYQACSYQQIDDANKPLPALYLSDTDGKLHYSPELFIDNRPNKGMSLGRRLLIADFNNDKLLDIYINDTSVSGPKKHGYRDSYYLSQPNGTWLESSNTHLSHDNFKVYDHGGATGDIDNDGDMDIVLTELNPQLNSGFWCLMNDGSGFLKKRKCGGSNASSLELSDIDNDGDLDAIVGGMNRNLFTGVVWNDGRGNFITYNATPLKQYKDTYEGVPEVSASDLDNDGDMDIVYSRVARQIIDSKSGYKGSAIQFIENLGNKNFKEYEVIPLVEGSTGWIKNILFRDLDEDGDIDVYLNSMDQITNGSVFINNGNFNFSLIMPPEAYELYGKLGQDGVIRSKGYIEEKVKPTAKPKKIQEEELSPYQQSQIKLLNDQRRLQVCDRAFREFFGDYYNRTNKDTYFFVSLDSNKKNCYYEWSGNERTAFDLCEQNTKANGKCTIYAIGNTAVWGNPQLYKELTRKK
ncbi:VCBS repeat-containing protein [Candidatus Pseudothioglobus singularis]|nr:VCBS repeat-containing protein [Candidatus Pseudothioglobus singularis]